MAARQVVQLHRLLKVPIILQVNGHLGDDERRVKLIELVNGAGHANPVGAVHVAEQRVVGLRLAHQRRHVPGEEGLARGRAQVVQEVVVVDDVHRIGRLKLLRVEADQLGQVQALRLHRVAGHPTENGELHVGGGNEQAVLVQRQGNVQRVAAVGVKAKEKLHRRLPLQHVAAEADRPLVVQLQRLLRLPTELAVVAQLVLPQNVRQLGLQLAAAAAGLLHLLHHADGRVDGARAEAPPLLMDFEGEGPPPKEKEALCDWRPLKEELCID
ncbi:hypothetical protein TYRP_012908 [Tyrophagus putrescentiae]|nr:hypothetical protein TYRP_012908 [Tyrophagus putrescentiae]